MAIVSVNERNTFDGLVIPIPSLESLKRKSNLSFLALQVSTTCDWLVTLV